MTILSSALGHFTLAAAFSVAMLTPTSFASAEGPPDDGLNGEFLASSEGPADDGLNGGVFARVCIPDCGDGVPR